MAETNTQRRQVNAPLRALLPSTNPRRALERSERAVLVGAQADRRRCEILLEMGYRGGPGNGQHGGGTLQQPGQRDLAWCDAVALGDPGERRTWAGEPARCQRVPGNKGDAGTGAQIDQPVGRSVAEIVAILDGDDSATARARASSLSETFDTPIWRIFPPRWRSTSAPTESSIDIR